MNINMVINMNLYYIATDSDSNVFPSMWQKKHWSYILFGHCQSLAVYRKVDRYQSPVRRP
jgi:hypothetical protein